MAEGLVKHVENGGSLFFEQSEVDLWRREAPELIDRLRLTREKHPLRKGVFRSPNAYILPFRRIWLAAGAHIGHCTRYAIDFVVIAPSHYGQCRRGMSESDLLALEMRLNGGLRNPQDFLCHGVEIIAPADGVILNAADADACWGDHAEDQATVIIDHGHNEYSRLCHVLGRSIRVKNGDHVRQGQLICLAGGRHGDGIYQTPHLHWDIWDHPHFLFAKGVPMRIAKAMVYANGRFAQRRAFYLHDGMLLANVGQEGPAQA
jgi:hypothetical protein